MAHPRIGDPMRPDYREICPSGASTYSKAPDRWPTNAPRKALRVEGARMWCEDGRSYVDCTSALGAILLGHGNLAVADAVRLQLEDGVSFSLPTEGEHELAWQLVQMVPGAEMCRFGKNGNDVVNAAVRLARAYTGKSHVLRGSYHGHADWAVESPMAAGVPHATRAFTRRVKNQDLADLKHQLAYRECAAYVMEVVPTHDPTEPTAEYMRGVRALCDRYGALWIMDEMVTGFRTGWPGAIANYDVRPDLWCGAKALGGGFPITALLGPREIMKRLELDVFYSTTFAGEAVSIAAALACLAEIRRTQALVRIAHIGRFIHARYDYHAQATALTEETQVIGYLARPVFRWRRPELGRVFLHAMVDNGVLCQGYINVMLAHAEVTDELDRAFAAGMAAARATLEVGVSVA